MRVIIDLTPEQLARLRQVSERFGISRAEAVRRAVETAYGTAAAGDSKVRESAWGIWRDRKLDALEYEDRIRREWSEREESLYEPVAHATGRVAEPRRPRTGRGKGRPGRGKRG